MSCRMASISLFSSFVSVMRILSARQKVNIVGMTNMFQRRMLSLAIVGSGQMGTGIGIVAARHAKAEVVLVDKYPESLERSQSFIDQWACKEVSKGRLREDEKESFSKRLTFAVLDDMDKCSALSSCDIAIEAVAESLAVKEGIFKMLDNSLPEEAILASNTSSISITKIAAATTRPEKVIGMHFMNPVPVMPLVEVICGLQTSDESLQKTLDLVKIMGKTAGISKDRPGFIANRILMPYINEAVYCLQEGVATRESIDSIMKLGTNVPMGPLMLADFIGLDTCLAIMRTLHQDLGDTKYRPSPLLAQYVDAGWLGRKSGRGFYEYKQSL